jgi:hypothetical protein
MCVKFPLFRAFFPLVLLFVCNRGAIAEFACQSDVSYKWARTTRNETVPQGASAGATKGPAVPAATAGSGQQAEPLIVRFLGIERVGKDEAEAKRVLETEINRQKVRASEDCLREHEAFGVCVATKLSTKSSVLNSLSFSARADLEKALTEECQGQQGRCLGVEASQPVCRELVSAQPTVAADAKKAEPKKK